MFSFLDLIKKNNATFYDFRDGKRQSVVPRIILTLILSFTTSFLLRPASNDFLNGVIATQAILIGFGFSVLFSIGSGDLPQNTDDGSIEASLTKDRLGRITIEIFYNISYFIYTAIGSLFIALCFLFSGKFSEGAIWVLTFVPPLAIFLKRIDHLIQYLGHLGFLFASTIFYFLLAESLFTFLRVVGRVFFLFDRKVHSKSRIR